MRKMNTDELKLLLKRMCGTFIVLSNTESQIRRALELNSSDIEDALQYQTAIDANCDCIITRNEKDFTFSTIPVMSATAYLNQFI